MRFEQIIDDYLSRGKYSFMLKEFRDVAGSTAVAVKRGLAKLTTKGKVKSIKKEFYVIITPEYKHSGLPPATHYLDALTKSYPKKYYLGLLSAAALHGAGHQQPQQTMVIIPKPPLRQIRVKNQEINFITKASFPSLGIEAKNVRTGILQVSDPALTAMDLIQFDKHCGTLVRVHEVLSELIEAITLADLSTVLENKIKTTVLQQAGFLFAVLNKPEFSEAVRHRLGNKRLKYRTLPDFGTDIDPKWCYQWKIRLAKHQNNDS